MQRGPEGLDEEAGLLVRAGAGASLVTAATALLAVSVVISLLLLVPINNRAVPAP